MTDLLVRVLDNAPATTCVMIGEVAFEDWGIGGVPLELYRLADKDYAPLADDGLREAEEVMVGKIERQKPSS